MNTDDRWRFISGAFAVLLDAVDEGRNPSKMGNVVIFFKGDWREVVGSNEGKGVNGWYKVISPGFLL